MTRTVLFVLSILSSAIVKPLDAGLITNGSFENSSGGFPDDWISTGNMTVVPHQGHTDGLLALAFGHGNLVSNGIIYQTFSTTMGTIYDLTFDFGKFSQDQPLQAARLEVEVFDGSGFAGAQLLHFTAVDTTPESGDPNSIDSPSVYKPFHLTFTATSGFSTLRFVDISDPQLIVDPGDFFDAMLDHVNVEIATAAVPEPSSFAIIGALLASIVAFRNGRSMRRLGKL
jgi:hypothetical protein